jgi:hypothetical protein
VFAADGSEFEFNPTNHSVVKADFGDPCVPFDYHRRDEPMFYSGQKISKTGDEKPVWTMKVYDANPVFFYWYASLHMVHLEKIATNHRVTSSAPGSCLTWKMIGVINPNSTWSLENQLKFHANTTKFQLSPGDPYPEESPTLKGTTTAPVTPSPTSSTADNGGSGGGGSGLSAGGIAGVAIGGAAVLVLAAALVWFCGRREGIEMVNRQNVPVATSVADDLHFMDRKSPGFQSSVHYPSGVPSQQDPFRSTSPGQWSHSQPQLNPHPSITAQSGGLISPTYAPGHSPQVRQSQQDTISPYQ